METSNHCTQCGFCTDDDETMESHIKTHQVTRKDLHPDIRKAAKTIIGAVIQAEYGFDENGWPLIGMANFIYVGQTLYDKLLDETEDAIIDEVNNGDTNRFCLRFEPRYIRRILKEKRAENARGFNPGGTE